MKKKKKNKLLLDSWFLAETLKYLYLLLDGMIEYLIDTLFASTQKEREDFEIVES